MMHHKRLIAFDAHRKESIAVVEKQQAWVGLINEA